VEYLGHVVGANGFRPNGEKVDAILQFPCPSSLSEVRTFLGMANYYRRFIPHFSDVADPLLMLTRAGSEFHWGEIQQRSFEQLRVAIASCTTLQ
jgi:hypothetical protein